MELQLPLPSMTYANAMLRYGTDRPDTRYGLLLSDVTDAVAGCKLRCAHPTSRFHIQLCNLLGSGWPLVHQCPHSCTGTGSAGSGEYATRDFELIAMQAAGRRGGGRRHRQGLKGARRRPNIQQPREAEGRHRGGGGGGGRRTPDLRQVGMT